ncbi:unnamed protein product [Acanthocheilonema viteae]|uniref:Uncharacterized protein n=1 Tax=Acanthocheilonema viteae TaxID=6277 RepID=A0A498SA52_ACAVI|nr:unnamed protein product [Acanthocheilonema viteae]
MAFRNGSFVSSISYQDSENYAIKADEKQNIKKSNASNYYLNTVVKLLIVLLLPVALLFGLSYEKLNKKAISGKFLNETECSQTCRVPPCCITRLSDHNLSEPLIFLFFSHLEDMTLNFEIDITSIVVVLAIFSYKTSLRGEHVLDYDYCRSHSDQGRKIHDALVEAGLKRKVRIRMIENYPPKDKGDNEDGINFAKTGVISRRSLNLENSLDAHKICH